MKTFTVEGVQALIHRFHINKYRALERENEAPPNYPTPGLLIKLKLSSCSTYDTVVHEKQTGPSSTPNSPPLSYVAKSTTGSLEDLRVATSSIVLRHCLSSANCERTTQRSGYEASSRDGHFRFERIVGNPGNYRIGTKYRIRTTYVRYATSTF